MSKEGEGLIWEPHIPCPKCTHGSLVFEGIEKYKKYFKCNYYDCGYKTDRPMEKSAKKK